jgi:hypothetical protein
MDIVYPANGGQAKKKKAHGSWRAGRKPGDGDNRENVVLGIYFWSIWRTYTRSHTTSFCRHDGRKAYPRTLCHQITSKKSDLYSATPKNDINTFYFIKSLFFL